MRTPILIALLGSVAACGGGGSDPDAHIITIDARTGCDPAAALPTQFRPIGQVSTGLVNLTSGAVTTGTIDGTAGGLAGAADNPYIYIDLTTGTKVAVDDVGAYADMTWDVAFKRASIRSNGGDSGPGGRSVAIIQADSLDQVTPPPPASGYVTDDFASDTCEYLSIPGGEPMTGFGEWYDYNDQTHIVTPKPEVYVISRPDGTHTALEVVEYYGDATMPMRGAFYQVAWKDL